MDDTGRNGAAEVSAMLEMVDGLQADTRILVASVRDVLVWKELAAEGCDTFTVAPEVVAQLFREPLTDEAAAVFQAAAWRNAR
jgi:transaldolase